MLQRHVAHIAVLERFSPPTLPNLSLPSGIRIGLTHEDRSSRMSQSTDNNSVARCTHLKKPRQFGYRSRITQVAWRNPFGLERFAA